MFYLRSERVQQRSTRAEALHAMLGKSTAGAAAHLLHTTGVQNKLPYDVPNSQLTIALGT